MRRYYSSTEKASALALVAGRGAGPGAVAYAAKQLGVPKRTLYTWVTEHRDEIQAAVVAVEAELLPQTLEVKQRLLERLRDGIEGMTGPQSAVAYGIVSDKLNLGPFGSAKGAQVAINIRTGPPLSAEEVSEVVRQAAKFLDGPDVIDVEPLEPQ